ncbi:hypothetical protein HX122_13035 [Acinetobacter towneri]|uniref:hypothetical protein n=1 Tax=Acinetobacter towneri TaxID=202956 RepID=UPI00257581E2|nr:hypothetical protein [Acinetobacter towneri]MDM1755834.1 hypothetical protein [Acinetobacter towneri]
MTQEKLEKLYAYKGKEKILSEISSYNILYLLTISLHIFLTVYISIICALFIFSYNFFSTLDINILNKYISLNIGKNNTFSNDLKNASLYLFAAQATLIGLIFPIVIAYVSLASVGRASSDKLMNIYKVHTGFNLLASSSFLLLASYAFLFIFDSFFNISLFKIAQLLFLIWFLFNLYIIYVFLSKTMDFIYAKKKIEEIIKYTYNNKEGLRDGFLVIIDELKYLVENKSISQVEELDIQLVNFIEINYIKHKFDVNDLNFFISEIRQIIDSTLDYNNIHLVRRMLYIYYYIGDRLSRREGSYYLSTLLEMHHVTVFDLNNKLNVSNEFRYLIYSRFIDSWTSWDYILKENTLKASYNFYTIILATNSIRNRIEIDRLIDVFLNIPNGVKVDYYNRDKFETFNDLSVLFNNGLLNLCIDSKFCLIKNILESDLSIEEKYKYVKAILQNLTLIKGATAIFSETRIETSHDIVFSLFRVLSNRPYDTYLNSILSKSKESNRVVNRVFWGDTSNYLDKITESYAYIYDQFISKNSLPLYEINNYLDSLGDEAKSTLFIEIDLYLRSLQNTDFNYDFFEEKKKNLIKKRYIQFIRSLKDIVQLKVS